MFEFNKVREAIIQPRIKKFTFNYCILSHLNVFPKEINLVILGMQFNHMIKSLLIQQDDEKLSLLLQVIGMYIYHIKDDVTIEKPVVLLILEYSSSLMLRQPIPFNFTIVGESLMTEELIDQYHQINKDCFKIKKELLPVVIDFINQHPLPLTLIETNMIGMFNTKEKYLDHLIKN